MLFSEDLVLKVFPVLLLLSFSFHVRFFPILTFFLFSYSYSCCDFLSSWVYWSSSLLGFVELDGITGKFSSYC
jgi:hypothetical protein